MQLLPPCQFFPAFLSECSLPSPAGPRKCSCDVYDVIACGRRVFLVPGNTKSDAKVDALDRVEFEGAVRKIACPFRSKADTKTGGDERDQREGVVTRIGDIAGQIILLELLREVALRVG